ncbi:MAG TPA: glycosyltransferase [Acidimicrobiia bacterium]|nr:glycosyltransferase [Acidimicrobiia bacterium]
MTDGEATPKLAFLIAGMARSGTTLVQRMASELESVWVPAETHFWRHAPALSERYTWPLDRDGASDAIAWLRSKDHFRELDFDIDRALDAIGPEAFLWDLFRGIVTALAPPDYEILGEKPPDHLLWAEQLLDGVPELKLIGVVRDPREVLRSHRSVPWGIHDPAPFAEKWVHHARCLDDCRRLFPDRVLAFRYEDVVASPDEARSVIAKFLGVTESFEDVTELRDSLFSSSEWWKARSLGPIEKQPDTWQEELSERDVQIIEQRASSEMQTWGYSPQSSDGVDVVLPISAREVRQASRRASLQTAPLTAAHLEAWNRSDKVRARSWQNRATELQESLRKTEAQLRAAGDWQHQAKELRESLAHLRRVHDETRQALSDWKVRAKSLETALEEATRNLSEARSQLAEARGWKARASELQTAQLRSEIRRLEAEKRYRLTSWRLRRLRARRWWRMAGVLSRWRRAPWKVWTLVKEGAQTAFGKSALPSRPDLERLDIRIQRLRDQLRSKQRTATPEGLEAARRAFNEGAYERALDLLDRLPKELRESAEALSLANGCYVRMGELTSGLQTIRKLRRAKPDPKFALQERFQLGRLIETDPQWLPEVGLPKPSQRITPSENVVLHVLKESLPFYERGYTMRSHTTLLAQKQAGFEPRVVTSLGFPRNDGFEDFPLYEDIDGIPHHRLDLGPFYPVREVPFDHLLSDQAMLTAMLATEMRPALIQAGSGYRGYETALVGLAVAKYLEVPMIYEIRSFLEHTWTGELERAEEGEYYDRRYQQEIRCLTEANHIITIADSMRAEIIGRGIPAEKISVVPNVVDVNRFKPRPKSQELLGRHSLNGSQVIGYISNLGFREGIDNLIRAVGLLRDSGLDVKCLVVGDGPERDRLSALVDELGLGDHVVLTGHVPNSEILDYYAAIDLFVIPRIDDRAARLVTPLKPLEAMAMGIPVIAADLPALRELVSPGERGEVFRPSDPEHLADIAGDLLVDDDRRMKYAAAGRAWVESDRTLEANAHRYASILRSVLEQQ